ncbi:protein kinase [Bacillus spizizenii]|nr:protein kinase [Bacillus spizizenii]
MLSESGIRTIADVFIGDNENYYSYKSGRKLVDFFNSNFGFNDIYRSGFPSRWIYTVDNLKHLWNNNRFNEFLNLILSKHFVKEDNRLNEVQALERINEIVGYLNDELNIEGYKIYKRGNEYSLISEDNDLEFIGDGGFANVYKSRSTGLIVKKLKDDFKTHIGIRHIFKREFDLTKSLSDLGGVIKVYEFNESDYSYTMEEGETTLEEFIESHDHDETSKLVMIRQILFIMMEVHNRNIIHRDISPNNILLFRGQLKISDFGLGKDLDMFHSRRTMKSQALGQYHYCAPEQFMQLKEGDKRSDVFSLGSLINFIMTKDPRDNKHFLRNPVEKAKNENPNLRYSDATQLLKGIEKAIEYYQNNEHKDLVYSKIRNGGYDEDVENYIYGLNARELCKAILEIPNMESVILTFIKSDEKRAIEILQMIENVYLEVCHDWENYDIFGEIAIAVIEDNLSYLSQEISARILSEIMYKKNRFKIKQSVDKLLNKGIDPTIEDMLSKEYYRA